MTALEHALALYPELSQRPEQIGLLANIARGIPNYSQPMPTEKYPFRPGCGGNSIWAHLPRLAAFAELAPRGIIVEVGVGCCDGSTHALDLGLQKNTSSIYGEHVHIGVDLHEQPDGFWCPKGGDWYYLSGNSNDDNTVGEVRMMLAGEKPGIIYIDTEHSYECLKRELEIWPSLGAPDTLWLFHDVVGFPDMAKAIEETVQAGGIFYTSHDYRILDYSCSGLGALIPKGDNGAWLRGGKQRDPHSVSVNGQEVSA